MSINFIFLLQMSCGDISVDFWPLYVRTVFDRNKIWNNKQLTFNFMIIPHKNTHNFESMCLHKKQQRKQMLFYYLFWIGRIISSYSIFIISWRRRKKNLIKYYKAFQMMFILIFFDFYYYWWIFIKLNKNNKKYIESESFNFFFCIYYIK